MHGRLRRWEVPKGNSQDLIGKTSIQAKSLTNTLGYCVKVYPDLLMAEIESPSLGKRILPYSPDSGIRKGSTVFISIAANVPRITSTMHFGYTPEKTVVLDLDAGQEDGDGKYIYKNKSSPDWDENQDGEHVAHYPVIIKHTPGEKVYNVDLAGLKVGFTKVSLFYHPQARIELFKHTVEMIAISASIISKAGVKRFVFDESSRESGYSLEKNTTKTDDTYFDTLREYRGNVAKALKDDDVEISGYIPVSVSEVIKESILLTMVLDLEKEAYEQSIPSVSHEYKNRELNITGGSSEDVKLHSKLKSKANIGESLEKSRALVAKIDGEEFPIVYLKSVSKTGDVYEFNSGKKTTACMGDDYILKAGGKSDTYHLGKKNDYVQDSITLSHYPVDKESINKYEYFGSNISDHKGDVIENNHRKLIQKKIFSHVEYEVDKNSDLETLQKIISPTIREEIQSRSTDFKKLDPSLKSDPEDRKSIEDNNTRTDIISNASGIPFMVDHINKNKRSKIQLTDSSLELVAKDAIRTESDFILLDSKNVISEGNILAKDGMRIEGDFVLRADNIIMRAEDYFVVEADDMICKIENSIGFTFSESLYMQNTNQELSSDSDHVAGVIALTKDSFIAQSDSINIFGGDKMSVTAKNTAVYGAKRASIFGLDSQE